MSHYKRCPGPELRQGCPDCDAARQQAEHVQRVAAAERRGKCWASGLSITTCKATVCDCFDYPDIPNTA